MHVRLVDEHGSDVATYIRQLTTTAPPFIPKNPAGGNHGRPGATTGPPGAMTGPSGGAKTGPLGARTGPPGGAKAGPPGRGGTEGRRGDDNNEREGNNHEGDDRRRQMQENTHLLRQIATSTAHLHRIAADTAQMRQIAEEAAQRGEYWEMSRHALAVRQAGRNTTNVGYPHPRVVATFSLPAVGANRAKRVRCRRARRDREPLNVQIEKISRIDLNCRMREAPIVDGLAKLPLVPGRPNLPSKQQLENWWFTFVALHQ